MHRCFSQPGSQLPHNNPTLKPFSHAEWKGMEEFYMVLYSAVCYCLEWKSRSSVSQEAVELHFFALQRRMVTALWMYSQCMLKVLTLFVLAISINAFMWPECLIYKLHLKCSIANEHLNATAVFFQKIKSNQCSTIKQNIILQTEETNKVTLV